MAAFPSRLEREQAQAARFMKMIPMFTLPEAAPGGAGGAVAAVAPDVGERQPIPRSKAHRKPSKTPEKSVEGSNKPADVPEWLTDALKMYEEQQATPPRALVKLRQERKPQPAPQPTPPLADLLDLDSLYLISAPGRGAAVKL